MNDSGQLVRLDWRNGKSIGRRMKNPSALLAMIAAAMMLSACSADGSASSSADASTLPVLVRNSIRADASHLARAQGKLHLDPAGCIRIGDDKGPFVIWHHDSRIERAADGRHQDHGWLYRELRFHRR